VDGGAVGPRIVVERDASSLRVDANSTIQAVDVVVVGHKISQESLQIMMYRLMGCAFALAALSLGTSLQVVQLASSLLPTSWFPLLFSSLLFSTLLKRIPLLILILRPMMWVWVWV
jgi:hypothetical protein